MAQSISDYITCIVYDEAVTNCPTVELSQSFHVASSLQLVTWTRNKSRQFSLLHEIQYNLVIFEERQFL